MNRDYQAKARRRLFPERVENLTLSSGDYVAPGMWVVLPDEAFPHMRLGDPSDTTWPYMSRDIAHNWYVDDRTPSVGFVNRDEASILYNSARLFVGRRCLEIGCWRGWSTAHIAAGAGDLDVLDPVLERPEWREDVEGSLRRAGVLERTRLYARSSPEGLDELAVEDTRPWSFVFIDGDHEDDSPRRDAQAVIARAADDAMILFHDLRAPGPAKALAYLRGRGWRTQIYLTSQIMAVAWRGNVTPVAHAPDPEQTWRLPEHLHSFAVSGESLEARANRFAEVINTACAAGGLNRRGESDDPAGLEIARVSGLSESSDESHANDQTTPEASSSLGEALLDGRVDVQAAWSSFLTQSEELRRRNAELETALASSLASETRLADKVRGAEEDQAAWQVTFGEFQSSLRQAHQDSLRVANQDTIQVRAELRAMTERFSETLGALETTRRAESAATAQLCTATERLDEALSALQMARRAEEIAATQLTAVKEDAGRSMSDLQETRQTEQRLRAELDNLQREHDRSSLEARADKDRVWELESRLAQRGAERDEREAEKLNLTDQLSKSQARIDELELSHQTERVEQHGRLERLSALVDQTRSESEAIAQAWARAESDRDEAESRMQLARFESERAREEANVTSIKVASLQEELQRLTSQSGQEIGRLRSQINALQLDYDIQYSSTARLIAAHEAVIKSTSWRLTGPVRQLISSLRKPTP